MSPSSRSRSLSTTYQVLDICKQHTEKALVGADRMAAPGSNNKEARTARFDRIEQILMHTPHSEGVLELPNMDLPHLDDSFVTVMVEAEANEQREFVLPSGKKRSSVEKKSNDKKLPPRRLKLRRRSENELFSLGGVA